MQGNSGFFFWSDLILYLGSWCFNLFLVSHDSTFLYLCVYVFTWNAWFFNYNAPFIKNNVFWLRHFGSKGCCFVLDGPNNFVLARCICLKGCNCTLLIVFSISVPPMVLISEESINSWLGKRIFVLRAAFVLSSVEFGSASFQGCVSDWKYWRIEFKSACWAWRSNPLRFAIFACICSERAG